MAKAKKGNTLAKKKAIPPKHKPTTPPVITKIVITTVINNRQQFISHLSTTNQGGRFIPHFTTDRNDAKDFLSPDMAQQYIDAMHPPGMHSFLVDFIDVPFNRHPDPAGDGPAYEMTIANEPPHFFKPNTTNE